MSLNQVDQTHLSIAALASCFVRAMDQQSPGFQAQFDKQLWDHFKELKDNESTNHSEALETLQWTAKFLDRPFLES